MRGAARPAAGAACAVPARPPRRLAAGAVALLLAAALTACSDRSNAPASTPLPTKATLDRATQGLDAAQAEEARRRDEIDRATK